MRAVRSFSLLTRTLLSHHHKPTSSSSSTPNNVALPPICKPPFRFFSSENDSSDQNPKPYSDSSSLVKPQEEESSIEVQDIDNKELKSRIEKYFKGGDGEEALPAIFEAILQRKLSGKHEDTDDELMDELRFTPVDGVDDKDFESDFEEAHETDEDIKDLYSARDIVTQRMMKDEYFNMDDKKWDDIVQDAMDKGFVRDMRECEEILEDMLHWDKLLPDDIKQKVSAKLDELGSKIENQELEAEEAYEQYKKFEDKIVKDCIEKAEDEVPSHSSELAEPSDRKRSDDPPGVGPVLRWQTRVVFAPGGDAWHPKNRKVKLSVTVKELGLSKYQFCRLREIVGKRYHPGRDELTITSERFEHREENRKDCLRTLLNIIEEAGKANAMVEEARTAYVKQRLRANPAFMAKLHAKAKQSMSSIPA